MRAEEFIMEDTRVRKSWLWYCSVVLVAITSYILALGPMYCLWLSGVISEDAWEWIKWFYQPYMYLYYSSEYVRACLDAYLDLWKWASF